LQKRASKGAAAEEDAEKEESSDGGSARLLSGGVQNDALVGAVVASGGQGHGLSMDERQ
jgi:hypothetical protein